MKLTVNASPIYLPSLTKVGHALVALQMQGRADNAVEVPPVPAALRLTQLSLRNLLQKGPGLVGLTSALCVARRDIIDRNAH
jgi:hypothetical protein